MAKIKIKRGNENNLSQLEDGELGFTKDSKKLFVGVDGVNEHINKDSKYGVATSTTLGLIKSGEDITVNAQGLVSVNDNSHNHNASTIARGDVNRAGYMFPLNQALLDKARANRLAFLPKAAVTIEYTDDGENWTEWNLSEASIKNFFSGIERIIPIGSTSSTLGNFNANSKTRITLDAWAGNPETGSERFFTQWHNTVLRFSYQGALGSNLTIQTMAGNSSTWTTIRSNVTLSGWPGQNDIEHSVINYGHHIPSASSSHTRYVRYTFGVTGVGTATSRPAVYNFWAYSSSWNILPNNLALSDHLYSYDVDQNMILPNGLTAQGDITAPNFIGKASSATKLATARTINGINFDGTSNIPFYTVCDSISSAEIKEISVDNHVTNTVITVLFRNINTHSSPKIKINSLTPVPIVRYISGTTYASDPSFSDNYWVQLYISASVAVVVGEKSSKIPLAGNSLANAGKVYGVATQTAHDQTTISNGIITAHKATNVYRGTVRGTPSEVGKISVDNDGFMSVNGWDNITSPIPNMVELTRAALVNVRNSSNLIKGTQYCITDFVTTTNVNNDNLYRSSEHSFDVIVTADSKDTLNENARARVVRGYTMYAWTSSKNTFYTYTPNPNIGDVAYIDETSNGFIADVQINFEFIMIDSYIDEIFYRDEDADMVLGMNPNHQYFIENHAKVESWELKYCLDNDVDRFEWADRNGKGVIYYMKDEHLNECNYDFKNVKFNIYSDYDLGCWKHDFNNFPLERINTVAKYPQSGKFVYTFFIKTADASVIYDMENNFPHKNKILHQTVLNNFYTEKLSFLVFDLYKNSCKNNVFTNCKYGSFIGVEDVNISNSEIMVGDRVKNINLVDSDIFVLENVSNVKIAGTIQGSKLIDVSDTTISGNVDFYNLHDLHGSQITIGINENCLADFCNLNEPNFEGDQWIGFVCCMNTNVKGIKFNGCKPVLVDVDTNQ